MSRTKYIKFGARADKNLSDIPDPKNALDNILDNISTQVDANGNALRFTSDDILPLVGIADGPLGDRLTVSGNAQEFTQLAGTTIEGTLVGSDTTSVDVEPRVTIQDHINNFKVALGDPPWINGGSGPSASIISEDRLNQNTVNYPEAEINATQSRQGNTYRVIAGASDMNFDNLQITCNSLYGNTTGSLRDQSPVANTTLETTSITSGTPCVIVEADGTYDWSAVNSTLSTSTESFVNANVSAGATGYITIVGHSFVTGNKVVYQSGSGAEGSGFTDGDIFFVKVVTTDTDRIELYTDAALSTQKTLTADFGDTSTLQLVIPIGTRFTPTATATASGNNKVIPAKSMGNFVANKMYTILKLGTVSSNASEWKDIGVEGIPYVGQQFIYNGATQTTVADAFALEHWSIGDHVTHTPTGAFSGAIAVRVYLRNQTLPSGEGASVAENLDPNSTDLPVNKFYTKKNDTANLLDLVTGVDLWSDGQLELVGTLHPDFTNTQGGIVWEGYQSGFFSFKLLINGFFSIEEDVNDDGNWKFLKGVNAFAFQSLKQCSYSTVDNVTLIELHEEDDYRRVCENHEVEINGIELYVTEVYRKYDAVMGDYRYYAKTDADAGATGSDILEFEYDRSEYDLGTGTIFITPLQANGKRRKIRYSVWWYEPNDSQEQLLESKIFRHDTGSGSGPLSYSYFYTTDGSSDDFGRYTFPYFVNNHAKVTKQDSTAKLVVNDTISMMLYDAKQATGDIFPDFDSGAGQINNPIRVAKLTNTAGTLQRDPANANSPFTNVQEGDVLTFITAYDGANAGWTNANNKVFSFQLLEKIDSTKAYISSDIGSVGGANIPLNAVKEFIHLKNEGLVGTYKASRVSDTELTIRVVNGTNDTLKRSILDVVEGDLVYYYGAISLSATGHCVNDRPYVVEKITYLNDSDASVAPTAATQLKLQVSNHPSLTANRNTLVNHATLSATHGIASIYSSRGLNDITGVYECTGVFGVEVKTQASNSQDEIELTDTNYTRIADDDRVYFNPAIPQDNQSSLSGTATKVQKFTGGSGEKMIRLKNESGAQVNLAQTINPGATLVIVPSGSYSGSVTELRKNREYCVIPLNTAPPFGSYTEGLLTTDGFPNLEVKELSFKKLSYNTKSDFKFTATLGSNILFGFSPSQPVVKVGDLIKAEGANTGSVLSTFSDGIIYKVDFVDGSTGNFSVEHYSGGSWSNVTGNGSLPDITFTRLGEALSLEDVEFTEQTSDAANRGSESEAQAQEPDGRFDICYTPSGGSEETYRVLVNSRHVEPK